MSRLVLFTYITFLAISIVTVQTCQKERQKCSSDVDCCENLVCNRWAKQCTKSKPSTTTATTQSSGSTVNPTSAGTSPASPTAETSPASSTAETSPASSTAGTSSASPTTEASPET